MEMRFVDRAPLTGVRRLEDSGYLVAEVPVARTGTQDYAGYEVGRPDLAKVTVYRPAETVFDEASMATAAHKPVTDDHPKDAVTARNWDGIAKGWTGETVRKDEANGLLYVPMMLTTDSLIDKVESGKREVSCGYSCEIIWGDGTTPDGVQYQATQKSVRFNHVAVVDRGRAGSVCRVGDNWQPLTDNKEPIVGVKTITHDGVPIEVTDAAEAVIGKLIVARDGLKGELDTANREVGTLTADKATLEGKVTALTAQLADAKITPDKLEKLVADRASLVADAKRVAGDAFDAKGLDENGIRKAAVTAKLGDKAPTNDAAIEGAFAVLLAGVTDADPLRDAIRDNQTVTDADKVIEDARKAMLDRLYNPLKADA